MSEIKYQVFISSTFKDLTDERQAVSRAILNLGHIPSGMELFPATDESQLSYIKKVIDDCDYYILIIGGRYGSTDEEGLSYTEMEYNYAVETKKPILAFLHNDVESLPVKKVDIDDTQTERLAKFRNRVSNGRLVKFWSSLESLETKVLLAATNAFSQMPQSGWRRGNEEASAEFLKRFSRERQARDYWYKEHNKAEGKLKAYENLAESEIEIRYRGQSGSSTAKVTGESLIQEFAVGLNEGLSRSEIAATLYDLVLHKHDDTASEVSPNSISRAQLFFEVFEIAEMTSDGLGPIHSEKKWLLKAAFRPLKTVTSEYDDEIPF